MNPGYLFYVLLLCCVIMTAFGWKSQWFGSIRNLNVFLFFLGWILSAMFAFQILNSIVHGTALWLGFMTCIALLRLRAGGEALLYISVTSLFASIYLLMKRLSDFYPTLAITSEHIYFALVLSLFSSMMFKDADKQSALLSSGLVLGELMYIKIAHPLTITIGGLELADLWWLTFVLARVWVGAAWVCVWMLRQVRGG